MNSHVNVNAINSHAVSERVNEFPENIRLVIWDLDETFWGGTLTEGGIEYIQSHHDIVIELARRGIISSICSRNNFSEIEVLLKERGLWDYFVFPSIDWSSKGARLKGLVEAFQLRAPTVLFVDDNPMNRAEAAQFVPGMQVADPSFIADMLSNPHFQGKDDSGLSRLAQYKLLERRSQDMGSAPDNSSFLRESDIRVYIDYNVGDNLDRAIELINRTNQLNFTKNRLPEDQEIARKELRELLGRMDIQAGLVRVVDRYGDYGYCGIYVQSKWLHDIEPKLIHYCFSCRTLGMQVETWLYQQLGRPKLEINGDVLTDIKNPDSMVDWIRVDNSIANDNQSEGGGRRKISRVFVRGGCEMVAIAHYFEILADEFISEFAFNRDGLEVRLDHTQMLRIATESVGEAGNQSLQALGYKSADLRSAILSENSGGLEVLVLGFWAESNPTVFRHRELGFRVTYNFPKFPNFHAHNVMGIRLEDIPTEFRGGDFERALIELQKNYEYVGALRPEVSQENIAEVIRKLPKDALIFLLGATEQTGGDGGILQPYPAHIDLNSALRWAASEFDNVFFVDIDRHILHPEDRHGAHNHYSREVYYRVFEEINGIIESKTDLVVSA